MKNRVKNDSSNKKSFIIRGDVCFSKDPTTFETLEGGYLVCVDGESRGLYRTLPDEYKNLSVTDYAGCIIVPGLVDLHIHAPQFAFRGLGANLE
jgi:guanine deaminase